MKKQLLLGLSLLAIVIGAAVITNPSSVIAVDVIGDICQSNPNATACQDDHTSGSNPIFGADGVLTTIMTWLARIVGVVATIVVLVSGIMMIVSRGESSETATAKRALSYALIALVIALFAQAIVSFVLSKL